MGNRTSQTLDERLVDGFLQYEYTETWQVTASGIAASLLDADLPQIGQPYFITGVSTPVYCYSRRPTRRSDTQAKTTFDVVCTFTNATQRYDRTEVGLPAQNPEEIVAKVDIAFEEYSDPTAKAQFLGVFDEVSSAEEVLAGSSYSLPPYLGPVGSYQSITNSANDPIPNINVRSHNKRITYWTWHRDWDEQWDLFIDTVNDSNVTISQYDQDGLRLRYKFERNELLILDVIKEDHWKDGKLWFRRGVVMLQNYKRWLIEVPDLGFNEMLFVDQYNADGTKWTKAGLDKFFGTTRLEYISVPIQRYKPNPDDNAAFDDLIPVAVADPVYLNGYGRELGYPRPDNLAFVKKKLVYRPYSEVSFSRLGIE